MEHNAAGGLQIAHPGDEQAGILDADGGGSGVLRRAGAADLLGSRLLKIPLQLVDELVQAALLIETGGFAQELGAIEVGLRGEAPGALDKGPEGLPGAHVIDAGGAEFRSEERRVGKECRSRWSPYH